jgi:hypothetical protein
VGGVSDEAQRVLDEAARRRGEQHQRSKLFRELMEHTHGAVAAYSIERMEEPLETDDASCVAFFTKLMEHKEEGSTQWNKIHDAESCDLLRQALTRVFSNLLHADADFDFDQVLSPVSKEL